MADGGSHAAPDVDEVRARRLVIIDEEGVERICLAADADRCTILIVDRDGFQRVAITASPDAGTLVVSSRTPGQPTRIDLFALDAEDSGDAATVGIEVIDEGNSVGGLQVRSGTPARTWTMPLV